jgi:Domain of unknown function (DUF4430)
VTRIPGTAVVTALCVAATAGCGVGPGEDAGEVEVSVTRDYGAESLLEENESIDESDTVLRVLDRVAEIETRYGGGFVQSIDGLAGGSSGGRRSDWFYYVNGIESPVGAADYDPGDGDRIWWDYRDWTSAMRVPAVVGSWPEPFLHGFQGERWTARITCLAPPSSCGTVSERLDAAGVRLSDSTAGADGRTEGSIEVLVGTWRRIRSDADARLLAAGPAESGVFATFTGSRRPLLNLLNEGGEPAGSLGRSSGLVAAVRPGQGPPTWLVTGTDPKGVAVAAKTLDGRALGDRYAVVVEKGIEPTGVPVP